MKIIFILGFCILLISLVPGVSAAHYIVGIVNDALDGTQANDHEVFLWQAGNGVDDNLTDIIGPNGDSNTDNNYMIDCELLNDPCKSGDIVTISVYNTGDGYVSVNVTVKATGQGYNEAPNITLNSPPNITSFIVDDALASPIGEVDLVVASTREVVCDVKVNELDGDSVINASSEFYDDSSSYYGDSEDNNTHYTNDSCYINGSYGGVDDYQVLCSYQVWYYANYSTWRCFVRLYDGLAAPSNDSNTTQINQLLSIGVPTTIDFGEVDTNSVSDENVTNVTNYGNVAVNLSIRGYAVTEGDNFSMNCTDGFNISVEHEKYNLTASNPGALTLGEADSYYINLTSNATVKQFNLDYRKNDNYNEAVNQSYWRIYLPPGPGGSCSGNIVFGAIVGGEG